MHNAPGESNSSYAFGFGKLCTYKAVNLSNNAHTHLHLPTHFMRRKVLLQVSNCALKPRIKPAHHEEYVRRPCFNTKGQQSKVFVDNFVSRFAVPLRILSNQGHNFKLKDVR